MLTLPTRQGYIVEYETDNVSPRTGNKLWHEVLCTKDKEAAEKKMAEFESQGFRVRVLEAIL